LDLAGGFDQVWTKGFTGQTRNHIRRAERSGLSVECDTTGRLIPEFYGLFEQSLVRWANQQHEPVWLARWRGHQRDPLRKLQMMAKMLGDECRVWVARFEGRPAAALIVLQGTNAHYTRGAMDKELASATHANDLLQRLAIEDACRAGCHHYDMGESGTSESLAHFKSRFGAVGYSYAEYYFERLPLTRWNSQARGMVKQIIGFKDA
jgi:lipid II:glycine glycyltransferase (peptidoglycan interpeptide bridge formation enzyme)